MTKISKPSAADQWIAQVEHDFLLLGRPIDFVLFSFDALLPDSEDIDEVSLGSDRPGLDISPDSPDETPPKPEKEPPRQLPIGGAGTASAREASAPGEDGKKEGVTDLPPLLPILPVDKLVVFPHMIAPITLSRESHKQLVDDALKAERLIGVFTRKGEVSDEEPDQFEHLHDIGTVCVVLRMLRVPDGSMRLLVHGVTRAQLAEKALEQPYLKARLSVMPDEEAAASEVEIEALKKSALSMLQKIIEISSLSEELGVAANNISEPGKLADLIASNIQLKTQELMEILGETNVMARMKRVLFFLSRELQVLELGSRIQTQVKTEIDRNQRQYVLREQMRAIRQELGEEEPHQKEIRELRERLEKKKMPDYARQVASKELDRLEALQPAAAEYGVIRTYLEWFFDLPWEESTPDNIDIKMAAKVLDEDHYGLEKIKERILEFLAVLRLRESMKGPILCFAGAPGVGKTSLGRSIARATGRRFTRFSLGGIRDEAEIRGHRRTYIGAMPGRIIKSLKDCGSNNPLIMLDEIDKLGMDFRGDPASALLEVLDPEQNYLFSDHYMEVPFDLSRVMFITTANQLEPVPGPLRDRMEIIELSGYTPNEKYFIARDYLIPREMIANGVRASEIKFTRPAVMAMISDYTREAGVRNLQREIANICRKTARRLAEALGPAETSPSASPSSASPLENQPAAASTKPNAEAKSGEKSAPDAGAAKPSGDAIESHPAPHTLPGAFGRPKPPAGKARIAPIHITPDHLREFLGPPKAYLEMAQRMGQPGVAIGMAWTPTGGDILFIEASRHPGSGKLILTGSLGDVMKESAQAALTYLHSQSERLALDENLFSKSDIHVHVPAGAVPKDGPSAGSAIASALASLLTGRPVRDYLAMTGEITLRGNILPVGGIKEKCMAAQRAGIRTILLPSLNKDDHSELPEEVRKGVGFHFVERIDDVLGLALAESHSAARSASRAESPAVPKKQANSPKKSTRKTAKSRKRAK